MRTQKVIFETTDFIKDFDLVKYWEYGCKIKTRNIEIDKYIITLVDIFNNKDQLKYTLQDRYTGEMIESKYINRNNFKCRICVIDEII